MRVGRLWGINIYLNPFFLALLGLFFVAGILDKGLIAFSVVLFHEFAHALVAKKMGVEVEDVELLPFGGVTRAGGDMPVSPFKETCIALAGPIGNLCLLLVAIAFKNYGFWNEPLGSFFIQCNIIIAVFNILPALPLDGGRIYRAYLAGRVGLRQATYRAAGIGQVWAALIITAGAVGLVLGWAGLDILITGMFLFYAATRERMSAPYLFMRHLFQKKEDLLSSGVLPAAVLVAREDATLGQVIRHFVPEKFHLVVVYSEDLSYKAVLPENKIIDCLFSDGIDHHIGQIT